MVWALSISYEPRSLFATREGKRCTKGSVHPVRHPRVQLGERASKQASKQASNKKLPSVRAARIWSKQLKKVGITYFSFVFSIFFGLGCA